VNVHFVDDIGEIVDHRVHHCLTYFSYFAISDWDRDIYDDRWQFAL